VKLLFTTPNNLELLDMLSRQFRYRLRIGRPGRLCSLGSIAIPAYCYGVRGEVEMQTISHVHLLYLEIAVGKATQHSAPTPSEEYQGNASPCQSTTAWQEIAKSQD
jgi:hypothetical protein